MNLNENIKTNNASVDSESSIYKRKDLNAFIKKEGNLYSVKENSASSNNDTVYSKENAASSLQSTGKENRTKKKKSELEKRKVVNMLINENIAVGYTSMTEMYLNQLLKADLSLTKDVLNLIYSEHFDNPDILQKITEVMSNLDYEKLYPTNTILVMAIISHTDINVQEAVIASFEKWDDKRNLKYLNNINYTADWIEDYANSVIDYLESC
ncbi:hypothetical protein [Priestia megaterium]